MSNNTNTIDGFTADLNIARKVMERNPQSSKRVVLVKGFLSKTTDEARQEFVDEHAAGEVRRELRQMAIRCERAGNQDEADAFWALRDDIDEDGDVFRLDADLLDAEFVA